MLAPSTMTVPGFGLASQGLAIKMVVMQLINANIQAYVIARIFGWQYDWFYQIAGLLLVITLGYIAKFIANFVLGDYIVVQFVASGVAYLLMIGAVLYYIPWLAGLDRKGVIGHYSVIKAIKCNKWC